MSPHTGARAPYSAAAARDRPTASHTGGTVGARSPRARSLAILRKASNRDQIDAVTVAGAVGQVVPQVCAVNAHTLAIGQHTHIVPVDLRVTEARPAVRLALLDEDLPRALLARGEERLARHRVVEGRVACALLLVSQEGRRALPVAAVLGVVPVVRADAVGQVILASPAQLCLHGLGGGAVLLRRHDGFLAHHARCGKRLLRVEHLEEAA
mmetsp:Transcript_20478/g.48552  ORF Transcript_20478/g.48552 Transcript_20478/m.48552 type:complete len:211 (+) Transcript_20478:129-761(+)